MANIFTTSNISFADIQNEFNPNGANMVHRNPISIGDFYSDAPSKFTEGIPIIPMRGNPISLSQFIGIKKTEESDWFYTIPGTYTWICPPRIYSVNVVCIGGGGNVSYDSDSHAGSGGGGGGLGWVNNISVIPGTNYTVVAGGVAQRSYFGNSSSSIIFAYGDAGETGPSVFMGWKYNYSDENGNRYYESHNDGGGGGGYGGLGSSLGGGQGARGSKSNIAYTSSYSLIYRNNGIGGDAGKYNGNGSGANAIGTGLLGLPDTGTKYGAGSTNGAVRIIYTNTNRFFPDNVGKLGTNVNSNLNLT